MLEEEDWEGLISNDQLKREQEAKRIFHNFHEAPINFAPTFKLNLESVGAHDRYNLKRIPSYCDRVLWTSQPGVEVVCDKYESYPKGWKVCFLHSKAPPHDLPNENK